ncbi:MAG: hypothetical protein VXZ96_01860 [Myxococcota bacterium]|nr:hypothetical protein [Myxococcota bacterium]
MFLTSSEERLAETLNCSAETLLRAKIILNLILNMDALTSKEKYTLLKKLANAPSLDILPILNTLGEDLDLAVPKWGISLDDQRLLLTQIGDISVSTQIPTILEELTGCASAVVETTNSPPVIPVIDVPPQAKVQNFNRVEVIFCQHDPTSGTYQYTLLLSGHHHRRQLSHSKQQTSLADFIQIPTAWGHHQIYEFSCNTGLFPARHPDEAEILADMIRQYGPFDVVFKLEYSCELPIPNLKEAEIRVPSTDIHIFQHQSIKTRGLAVQHNSRVELAWPESTQLESPNGHEVRLLDSSITQNKRKVADRHHSRARSHIHISQIHGEKISNAHVKCTDLKNTEHLLQGLGGVGAMISGQAVQFYTAQCESDQIYHREPLTVEANWRPSLERTSGQMKISTDKYQVDLNKLAIRTAHRHRPVQHRTPPMRISETHELTQMSETHPLPFDLQIDSVAELESQIQATEWQLANKAQQSVQVSQRGDIELYLHIQDNVSLRIECKPQMQLEELISGENTQYEHQKLMINHEYQCLKQPEYVVMTMKSHDISRTWKVENRCHRHIWSVRHDRPVRIHQANWMDEAEEWSTSELQHHIRVGWSDVGWWISPQAH